MDQRLTNSQMRTFNQCPRKAQYAYQLGIRPVQTPRPLRIGSAFHLSLDLFAKSRLGHIDLTYPAIVRGVLDKYDEQRPGGGSTDEQKRDHEIEKEILRQMFEGYLWRWKDQDAELRIVSTEQGFEVPLVNPKTGRSSRTFVLAGKLDKIIAVGSTYQIQEHKTTTGEIDPSTDIGQRYFQRLRIDSQVSTYMIAAKHLGYDPKDVLYDVIRVPTIEPHWLTQGETKTLLETGEYRCKLVRGDEQTTSINMDTDGWPMMDDLQLKVWREERAFVVESKERGEDLLVTIDGEEVDAKKGAKYDANGSFAIRESISMFGKRILADMVRRHERYFQRRAIPRLESDLVEHMYGIWALAEQFKLYRELDLWPKNDSQCLSFGVCPYFGPCTSGFDPRKFKNGEQELPDGFIVVDDVHQELLEQEEVA